jgi:predicted transcriptional regulator
MGSNVRLGGSDAINAMVIEEIASETHLPAEEVRHVFDNELAHLRSDARVTDYLVLFASRRTREILARRH